MSAHSAVNWHRRRAVAAPLARGGRWRRPANGPWRSSWRKSGRRGWAQTCFGGLRRLAARCQAQQLPARRFVAGPGMLLRIHIRFQQHRARSMELVPVGWQLSRCQRQRVRGKILHLHPGQQKKPRIPHHQLQMGVVGLCARLTGQDQEVEVLCGKGSN